MPLRSSLVQFIYYSKETLTTYYTHNLLNEVVTGGTTIRIINVITIVMGFISLGLGITGIFLPGLPSTPFMLITVFCFSKGSPRLNNWLCNTKLYKQHLSKFIVNRMMTMKMKVCILIPATAMIAVALIFSPWWQLRIFLSFLLLLKYIYFCVCIPTIAREPKDETILYKNNTFKGD